MHEAPWRSLIPDLALYQSLLEQYDCLPVAELGALQGRLTDAIHRFVSLTQQPHILRVIAPENALYRDYLIALLAQQHQAKNPTENHNAPIIVADNLNELAFFGGVYPADNTTKDPQIQQGLIHQANGGYLIVSISALLAVPHVWFRLKEAVLSGQLAWQTANTKLPCALPSTAPINVKIILVGDRFAMNELGTGDPDILSGISMYGEFEQDLLITESSLPLYLSYIKRLCQQYQLPPLQDRHALETLLMIGARHAEEQHRVPLCPIWHQSLLSEAALESQQDSIKAQDLQKAVNASLFRESYLIERSLDEIHQGHVLIDTDGEKIGQINGLTVVEMPGHPRSYGEPARISCVVHFGDGEISDIERKVELGGNIHAKGMMIMQAFLATELGLDHHLPYSASIAFEQSYGEIDGDSASLAELCALISSLSQQPIQQNIAVTGAIDQFGRVLSIGGINTKIEGFYDVCLKRGLTGKQGVILPASNKDNLCLNADIVEAVKEGQFHIWTVNHVNEALVLLTGLPFTYPDNENTEKDSLLSKINDRIDDMHPLEDSFIVNMIIKIKNWFVQH